MSADGDAVRFEHPRHRGRLAGIAAGLAVLSTVVFGRPAAVSAQANAYCGGQNLAEGANWSICWEIRANEGLAITQAFYKSPDGWQHVMSDGTVAQIFVPYETGTPRYHDVAYGLGAAMQPLNQPIDCAHGSLLQGGKVCREIMDSGIASRFCAGNCAGRRGKALRLLVSSQMGAYNYLTSWMFHDDGTIHPQVGLAGALQFGNTAHLHNIYWRLDIDIEDPEGDSVEEFYRVAPVTGGGATGANGWNTLLGETYRPTDLTTFRKWRVVDHNRGNSQGLAMSYELIPSPGDGQLRAKPNEGFSRGEFWVTKQKPGERFVSTDDADILSTYITGDNVINDDIVIWYAVHAYHEVRSEDAPYMPVEWVGFHMRPRDFMGRGP